MIDSGSNSGYSANQNGYCHISEKAYPGLITLRYAHENGHPANALPSSNNPYGFSIS